MSEHRDGNGDESLDRAGPGTSKPRRSFLQGPVGLLAGLIAGCIVIASVWSVVGDPKRRAASAVLDALSRAGAPSERINAIRDVVRSGPQDTATALTALLKCLDDADAGVRVEAVLALGTTIGKAAVSGDRGPYLKSAISAHLRLLKDQEPAVRCAAAGALVPIGQTSSETSVLNSKAIAIALTETLRDRDAAVRARRLPGWAPWALPFSRNRLRNWWRRSRTNRSSIVWLPSACSSSFINRSNNSCPSCSAASSRLPRAARSAPPAFGA